MTKQQSLEKIKGLIERYENLSEAEKRKYNEQATKNHFIQPLFKALGWDFELEVWPEEKVSNKRVDWAFKMNDVTKFFVEAKPLKVNLDEERYAEQAIDYSWHKSVPWVILTDFEAIKVFNTEWDEPDIQSCQFFEIKYKDYLKDKRLWWLSREAFEKGILSKEADKLGRRPKTTIDKQLAEDLVRWRDFLNDSLCGWNSDVEEKKIGEYVQRILDRLIFIRTLENRGIENVILQALVREWKDKKGVKANELLFALNKTFRKIDDYYNSGLFAEDACDHLGENLNADDNDFVEIINELYKTKKKGIRYNFADIPADVFGSIYEQYLGHIQQEDEKQNKKSKRKSQGIYYTPRYIVDYIVQNTLGEVLKTRSPSEIRKLKVLDPACGSGSFLISAYQTLIDYWQKELNQKSKFKGKGEKLEEIEKSFKAKGEKLLTSEKKQRILLDNIYGVDLDEEAAELAKLNLLLKMVGKRAKLPKLENNIQVGNSLISGNEKELKKYFGKDWKDKKPFDWKEKYDVVIGNPPYVDVRKIQKEDKKYLFDKFSCTENRTNTFSIFIEASLLVLNDGGYLGFIIPNTILTHSSYRKVREKILNECIISKIYDLGKNVFQEATVETVVIILKKEKNQAECNKNLIQICRINDNGQTDCFNIKQSIFKSDSLNRFILSSDKKVNDLIKKLRSRSINLGTIYHGYNGINPGNKRNEVVVNKKINEKYKKVIDGKHIKKYAIVWRGDWILYDKDVLERARKEEIFLEKPKIMLQKIGTGLVASLDEHQLYALINTTILLRIKGEYNPKYVLALLNSKLLNFFYKEEFLGVQIKTEFLEVLPIYKIDFSNKKEKAQHDELVKLADKMLKLNKDLQKLDAIMDEKEYKEKKKEIEVVDGEIDERVFELYGVGVGGLLRIGG